MNNAPLVSIIVSIYNIQYYISECLDSIINQSYINLEIICVNDGSVDNSLKIIEDYSKKDKRIQIITQENQGLSVTRNIGIDYAKGKYIYFIDGDDFISKKYIEEMVRIIIDENTKVIHNPNHMMYYEQNSPKNYHINIHLPDAFQTNNITHSIWSKVFDLSFLKKTKLKFKQGLLYEDYEFWNKFIAHLSNMSFCESEIYYYRQRENSITDKTKKQSKYNNHILVCIDSIYSYYEENKNLLNFKPLLISLLKDHLYHHNKKFHLKFILEARSVLKKFDDYFIKNIISNNRKTYIRYTNYYKILELLINSYITKKY